jgi:cellulose biosynthesis protein BcsQ
MSCVIGAVNLKGGVGKTSAVLHLCGALSLAGRRVLAVDNDPQSSLPALVPAWFLVSMYQARRSVHQVFVEHLREAHGADVFSAMIPEAVDFIEAVTARKPVAMHKPRGAAAKAMKAVAEELLARLAAPAYGRSITTETGEAA